MCKIQPQHQHLLWKGTEMKYQKAEEGELFQKGDIVVDDSLGQTIMHLCGANVEFLCCREGIKVKYYFICEHDEYTCWADFACRKVKK